MVRDVSSWFAMVHVMVRDVSLSWFRHGSSWFVMFYCHGFIMVRHGLSWFIMVHVMVHDVSLSWVRHGS